MSTAYRPLRQAGLLACLCALASLSATAGELYQWTDANGVTHYSDSPPPDREQYQSRRYSGDQTAPSVAGEAEAEANGAVSSQCATARANLDLLKGEGPVGIDNDKDGKPDGQLDPDQRAAQRALAEAAIKVHCAAAGAMS